MLSVLIDQVPCPERARSELTLFPLPSLVLQYADHGGTTIIALGL